MLFRCFFVTMQQFGLLVHKFWYLSRIDARWNKSPVLSLIVVVVDEDEDIALGISIDILSRLSSHSVSIKISLLFFKRGVGGDRSRGELRFHAKIEGTTPGFKDTAYVGVVLKSSAMKCLEQTLFEFDIEKFLPKSLHIVWIHCFLRFSLNGKRR